MATVDPNPNGSRFQFTLRTLLWVFLVLSVCLGLIVWQGRLGTAIAVLFCGVWLLGCGIRSKNRKTIAAGGVVISIMALVFLVDMSTTIQWNGECSFVIRVCVVDDANEQPISRPQIKLGREYNGHEFADEDKHFVTVDADHPGSFEVGRRFGCGGTDSGFRLTRDSRHNFHNLTRYYVYVEAPGYDEAKASISKAIGKERWPRDKPLPTLEIRLTRKGRPTPAQKPTSEIPGGTS